MSETLFQLEEAESRVAELESRAEELEGQLGRTAVDLFDEAKRRQGEVYNLRRELLALSETLSATTIMSVARRLRELGEGA